MDVEKRGSLIERVSMVKLNDSKQYNKVEPMEFACLSDALSVCAH